MASLIGLDFETFSDVDLRKHGMDRYMNSPNFKVLVGCLYYETPQGGAVDIRLDFVNDYNTSLGVLERELSYSKIAAHNASFEIAVLKQLGLNIPTSRFIDTAVLSRAAGYGSSLEAAAAQILGEDKVSYGAELIKKFCVLNEWHTTEFNPLVFNEPPLMDWTSFKYYCHVDAKLSYKLAQTLMHMVGTQEINYSHLTMDMNEVGWPVDMPLVRVMNRMYKSNVQQEVDAFRALCDEENLNLNSHTQLIAWCKERGVTARSFDEKSVASMLKRVQKRIDTLPANDPRAGDLHEVRILLMTKQVLGGSSLKKLDTIENMVGADDRLRNQYMHVGAGATFRTSGRGVQMQNLKRLHGEGDDMRELMNPAPLLWHNDKLATNLRQVFAAADPGGRLIVGDFSSVESRGLAWQAGEEWKLKAYHQGQDLYKVQASMMFNAPVDTITKDQRQVGKVGELACGYGAGPDAVKDFAEKMSVDLSQGEATKLVRDWRDANSNIVDYWNRLDSAMHEAITTHMSIHVVLAHNAYIVFRAVPAPESLRQQVKNDALQTLEIRLHTSETGSLTFTRVVHGVSIKGRNVTYWKPSDRKTGDLWSDSYIDPKTKQRRNYTLYGGKLSGLLTQSLCREIFMASLANFNDWQLFFGNVKLIGQFHDEIVVEHLPGVVTHDQTVNALNKAMSTTDLVYFPLAADIKSAYRYIK